MSDETSLPMRLHHYASVVRDQEKMRHFMEDILGFPLVATWAEKTKFHELPDVQEYCHTFYQIDDGGAIAFFQFANPEMYELTQAKVPAEIGRFHHIALRVDKVRYADLRRRLQEAGAPHRERDHGYCQSLYTTTDEGFELEFTYDADDLPAIESYQQKNAHAVLKRWLAGDYTPNNTIRH